MSDQDQELMMAREKLAARFGNATQIGGKGKSTWFNLNRNPEKKEEACQRPECQWRQEA